MHLYISGLQHSKVKEERKEMEIPILEGNHLIHFHVFFFLSCKIYSHTAADRKTAVTKRLWWCSDLWALQSIRHMNLRWKAFFYTDLVLLWWIVSHLSHLHNTLVSLQILLHERCFCFSIKVLTADHTTWVRWTLAAIRHCAPAANIPTMTQTKSSFWAAVHFSF